MAPTASAVGPEKTARHGSADSGRSGDLKVNVAKRKAATNVRSNKDATVVLNEPKSLSLDDCVEYIGEDELVEVTPLNVRILKNPKMDKKAMKQQGKK